MHSVRGLNNLVRVIIIIINMLKPRHWRICFQIFALTIFIFQMVQAVLSYLQYPIVMQTSVSPLLAEHKTPTLYVCQESQFSYLVANENGYNYFSDYMGGLIHETEHLGWMGTNNNVTAEDLFHILYETNYTDMTVQEFNNWSNSSINLVNNSLTFLFPHGFCMELKYSTSYKFLFIKTFSHRKILLVDPNRKNLLRTEENSEAWMSVGPMPNGLYEAANYQVSIEINNDRLNDGKNCIHYENRGTTYGECIEKAVKDQLMKWYGCLPVWFRAPYFHHLSTKGRLSKPPSDQCVNPITHFKDSDKLTLIRFQLWHLIINQDMDCMKDCLPPCITMNIKPRLKTYRGNFKHRAQLELVWDDQVTINKAVHSIEFFDLIVELGSALGLWLGLSAVSLLDYVVEYWHVVSRVCGQKTANK